MERGERQRDESQRGEWLSAFVFLSMIREEALYSNELAVSQSISTPDVLVMGDVGFHLSDSSLQHVWKGAGGPLCFSFPSVLITVNTTRQVTAPPKARLFHVMKLLACLPSAGINYVCHFWPMKVKYALFVCLFLTHSGVSQLGRLT